MPKILIAGYHGFGNCGDEAILLAMKNNIKALYGDVSLSVLSFKPEETQRIYGIKSINRFKPADVLKAIAGADILISGGGSLLQDETSLRSLLYYLAILFAARLFGKKTMLYSNGIGPVSKRVSKLLIRLVVNRVDLITLRESASLEELKRLKITKPPAYVTADPAFTLAGISPAEAWTILEQEGIPADKPLVGVSLRPWKGCDAFCAQLAKLCDHIIETHGVNILLIPMQYAPDSRISAEMSGKMANKAYILKGKYGSGEILGIIGILNVMMSMRLHSLIFAAVQNVPMLGFVYDPKVKSFLELMDMPMADNIANVDYAAVKMNADRLFQRNEEYRKELKVKTDELKQKAKLNDELLKKLF